MRLKVGLLGIGKIARDQHIPALNANDRFELAACASRNTSVSGIPCFPDLAAMLSAVPDLHCISICTPPQAHFDAALTALRAGKHVMLEKPPTATTPGSEVAAATPASIPHKGPDPYARQLSHKGPDPYARQLSRKGDCPL
jgi:predicted dehydrogenase